MKKLLVAFGWLLLGLILLEVTANIVLSLHGTAGGKHDWRIQADAYRGVPWVKDYYRDLARITTEWQSYVYWRCKPIKSEYINVDPNGHRQTWNEAAGKLPVKIFIFGGSTLWGTGSRDDYTIPSYLSKFLSEKVNHSIQVVNFGENGYVSTQEAVAFYLELQHRNVPDIVIFYDGVNDVFSTYNNQEAGIPLYESNRKREFNILAPAKKIQLWKEVIAGPLRNSAILRIIQHFRKKTETTHPNRQLAASVAQTYAANVRLIEDLCAREGCRPIFYWQPEVFTKSSLSPYEKSQAENEKSLGALFLEVNPKIGQSRQLALDPNFHDISEIFRSSTDSYYVDFCHLNESGNESIARRMLNDVLPVVRQRLQSRSRTSASIK